VEFEWDAAKNRSNLVKHGIAFEDVVAVFSDPVQLREPNRLAEGASIRFISARRASRRERERYERH